jgi:hypothetical protein
MKSPNQKTERLLPAVEQADEGNLVERLFYIDCDPKQAVDRTERAKKVSSLINESDAFGSLCSRDLINEAFQAEVRYSRDAVEASSRMTKFLALINMKLNQHLMLGPKGLGISDRLYLLNEHAPTRSLDLDLDYSECQSLNKTTDKPSSSASSAA